MASSVDLHVYQEQVVKAVDALFKFIDAKKSKDLLSSVSAEKINLQFTFQKVPFVKDKTIKIPLPNSLTNASTDVCLFVKDSNKKDREHEKTSDMFQELLDKNGITCIAKIVPLKALKLEYKPFEAKINLSNMYDVFLADERIVRLLPGFLGKSFYGRKRAPIQVNLEANNLKKEIEGVLSKAYCTMSGRGSCCMVTVANTNLTKEEVVENVVKSIECLTAAIPGGSANVKNLYLKTGNSPSLPLYVSNVSPNDVKLKKPAFIHDDIEAEDFTPLMSGKIAVDKFSNYVIVKGDETARDAFNREKKSFTKVQGVKKKRDLTKTKAKKMPKTKVQKQVKIKQPKSKSTVGKIENILPKKRKTVSKLKELKSSKKSVKTKLKSSK